ncbi:hypothetical protein NBRC116583_11510 [Arenicella sp. 4NH20-0111]|uniref:hypothetical protein n=1 Tax=Arenicella sp. 4NH20-0111 TaxID=3127648 RepID=UPI003104475A
MTSTQIEKDNKIGLVNLGVTLWVSFLFAAIATMLFFATFDPIDIAQVATFPFELDRISGYSIGFILFWALLIINSCIINWLSAQNTSSMTGSGCPQDKE